MTVIQLNTVPIVLVIKGGPKHLGHYGFQSLIYVELQL